MINHLLLHAKLAWLLALGRQVLPNDYAREYDGVAKTYNRWNAKMGKHTDELIRRTLEHIPGNRILDLCCGNGHIIDKLLQTKRKMHIHGVDISAKMVEECRRRFENEDVRLKAIDAADFLNSNRQSYNAILCGWALPYLNQPLLLPLIAGRLKAGGVAGFISNMGGTLAGLKEVYLEVMAHHRDRVKKVLTISTRLPADERSFRSLFLQQGLRPLFSMPGEEWVSFETPEKLLAWLEQTGACAGTLSIFSQDHAVRASLVEAVGRHLYRDGAYRINHKFVYGAFKKEI